MEFNIKADPLYPSVLAKLKSDEDIKLLDLGCCFGQDIRRLIIDGAPAKKLVGTDIEAGFIDLGYELFKDRTSLGIRFEAGDFFLPPPSGPNLEAQSFDFVHASAFFHVFSWDEQVKAMTKTLGLLKARPESMLFGRLAGNAEGKVVKFKGTRSGELYQHNKVTFVKLMREVEEKIGKELKVEVEEYSGKSGRWLMLRFSISLA